MVDRQHFTKETIGWSYIDSKTTDELAMSLVYNQQGPQATSATSIAALSTFQACQPGNPIIVWSVEENNTNLWTDPIGNIQIRTDRIQATQEIVEAFKQAKEEIFEDGMDSDFTKKLLKYIFKYEHAAVDIIRVHIFIGNVSTEASAEALRLIGGIRHSKTYSNRLFLLAECLSHSQPLVRDGAVVGIALMDNPSAIPYLERAMEVERNPSLKQDMGQVLSQLRETFRCLFC